MREFCLIKKIYFTVGFCFLFSVLNSNAFAQMGAIGSIDEAIAGGGVTESVKKAQSSTTKTSSKTTTKKSKTAVKTQTSTTKTTTKNKTPKAYDGFTIGDKYTFLNFEVTKKVHPIYRKAARDAGAVGLVQVEVLIDPNGDVISAKARTGNALLHPEAEEAALQTKFNKPSVYGKPARGFGFIVFRFGTEEDEYRMKQQNKP